MDDRHGPTGPDERRRRAPAPARLAALPVAAAVLLAGVSLAGAVPQEAVTVPAVDRAAAAVSRVLPQGWAFFTKPPQTPRYTLLAPGDDGLHDVLGSHAVDASTGFGLHRGYRNVAAEREAVERHLDGEDLVPCPGGVPEACVEGLDLAHPEHAMSTAVRRPQLCGRYYVAVGEPVPWDWRHLVEGTVRTTHVTTLAIACPAR